MHSPMQITWIFSDDIKVLRNFFTRLSCCSQDDKRIYNMGQESGMGSVLKFLGSSDRLILLNNGPLARYAKLWVAHAPGMPGTFSPPPPVSDPDMHHGTCLLHVPWCTPGSLTSGLLWNRWEGKRSRHSRRMRNPQCYVSGKRPMICANVYCSYPMPYQEQQYV